MKAPLPRDAINEIKKALAFKRLQVQEHLHGKSAGPEEIMNLYRESRLEELSEAILTTKAIEALAQQCPACLRIFGEHSEEELIQCIRSGSEEDERGH
jgi:hypothetical protein